MFYSFKSNQSNQSKPIKPIKFDGYYHKLLRYYLQANLESCKFSKKDFFLASDLMCILWAFRCVSVKLNFYVCASPFRWCWLIFRLRSIIIHFENWELCSKLGHVLCWRDYWWCKVLQRKRIGICQWLMKTPQTGSKFLLNNVYAILVPVPAEDSWDDEWAVQLLFKRQPIRATLSTIMFWHETLNLGSFPSIITFCTRKHFFQRLR